MNNKKPEFGNLEDIQRVQDGIYCECGHKKSKHYSGQNECFEFIEEEECECSNCGDVHVTEIECDCSEYAEPTD